MWTIEEFILPCGRWQWRSQRIVRSMCPSQYHAPGDSSDPRLSCWFSLSKVAFSLILFNDDCQAIYPRPTAVQLMHWLTSACRFCILYICLFVHLVNSLVCAFLCFFVYLCIVRSFLCIFVHLTDFSVLWSGNLMGTQTTIQFMSARWTILHRFPWKKQSLMG